MTQKELLKRLESIDSQITVLKSILSVLDWDQKTIMPTDGIHARSQQLSYIAKELHELRTSKELIQIINRLKKPAVLKSVSTTDKAKVRLFAKDIKRFIKLPTSFVQELTQATAQSESAWEHAKETNNYQSFKPHLKKMIELKLKECNYIDSKKHPYDVLLDDYDEGLTVQKVKSIFEPLKKDLKELYSTIRKNKQSRKVAFDRLPIEKQKRVCEYIQSKITPFPTKTVQAQSVHPFMSSLGPDDVRITTAFRESDPFFAITSTAHECGHALYELQFNKNFKNTILHSAASYTVHESQSRLWENHIVKSFKFWRTYYAKFKKDILCDVTVQEFYKSLNEVSGSLIRIEGDEVTYCLHIIIRFELELALFEKRMTVDELPEKWNNMYEEYFGKKPQSDTQGVLQDVHWSAGLFGYFPTYALGTMYAAMIFAKLQKIRPHIDLEISNHDFRYIREWLEKNIHRHGATKTSQALLKSALKSDMDPKIYLTYLRSKYGKIYGFS